MDWLEKLIDGATQVQIAKQSAKAQQYQQLGQNGYYTEGQPGVTETPQGSFVISTGMVMVAAGVLAVVLLMKD